MCNAINHFFVFHQILIGEINVILLGKKAKPTAIHKKPSLANKASTANGEALF